MLDDLNAGGPRVIAGVTDDGLAAAVITNAAALAAAGGMPLLVAHCALMTGAREPSWLVEVMRLARALAPGIPVRRRIWPGRPVRVLSMMTSPRDMVFVGAGTRAGREGVFGSTSAGVAAAARCAVQVVPGGGPEERGPLAGHVVVGYDGSPRAHAAVRLGFYQAGRLGSPLALVQAVDASAGAVDDIVEFQLSPWSGPSAGRAGRPLRVRRACFVGDPLSALARASRGARMLILGRRAGPLREHLAAGLIGRGHCPVVLPAPEPIGASPVPTA